MRSAAAPEAAPALPGGPPGRRPATVRPGRGAASSGNARVLALGILAALIAVVLGALAPAARADGDPGSDVLAYQDLFVPADAGVPVEQQVRLGNVLQSAQHSGFTIRVAIIAKRDDLGAVTALWGKPDAYARFLGIELSLAYTQRLLVVMPDGFGINWPGHATAAGYRLLAKVPVGHGGSGLAESAEAAVRALAAAAGVRVPASGPQPATAGPGPGAAAGTAVTPGSGAAAGSSGIPVPLLVVAALAAAAAAAVVTWLIVRSGFRLPWRPRLPRRLPAAVYGTWLAATLVVASGAVIVLHGAATAPGGTQGGTGSGAQAGALAANPDIDAGTTLSGAAPDFTLTDQFGQPASLRSYRGKVVILAFVDAECTTVCPLTTVSLLDARAMLGAAAADVQLVGIDANPKATAVEDVRSYSQLHGMLHQWRFLTGTTSQLESVWKSYSVGVDISQNLISHTPAVFVIGPGGELAKLYLTQMSYSAIGQTGQLLAQEASRLLPGHPPVRSRLSYSQIGGITPATASTLPRAGGGTVRLGPGRARLYLFFATWNRQSTGLAGQLGALDRYDSAAGASTLPRLTAVDEGSVEPSAAALRQFLDGLPHPLSYPVAVDQSGRVADGYEVQGAPWFVLVSADGRILWSWDISAKGWLTPGALARQVRAGLAQPPEASGQG